VLALNELVAERARAMSKTAVLLSCARKRPYELSKPHRRIRRQLEDAGNTESAVDKIVVSSIGAVPQHL